MRRHCSETQRRVLFTLALFAGQSVALMLGPKRDASTYTAPPTSISLTGRQPSAASADLSSSFNGTNLFSDDQRFAIQVVACVFGGLSMFGSLTVLYWFARMKRAFRHHLIVVLVAANVVRSMWYFIFPLVAFSNGNLRSDTPFCQASGFFTQFGVEVADFAILFIAIHTALQVFKPKPLPLGQGGLYEFRFIVYALCFFIPLLLASLAFIRGPDAYMYQGPTCNLALRPYWYRLGLSWIPRYIIMLTILILYISIYIHAGFTMSIPKFNKKTAPTPSDYGNSQEKSFRWLGSPTATQFAIRPFTPDIERGDDQMPMHSPPCSPTSTPRPPARKQSEGTTLVGDSPTRGSSMNDSYFSASYNSVSEPVQPAAQKDVSRPQPLNLTIPQRPTLRDRTSSDLVGRQIETIEMRQRRDSIRRHLRLLFVYPVVYFAVWLLPFVQNVLNYNSYYVRHPPFALLLLAYLAVAAMGLIDSIIFSLREQPWKHIPTSDGTFQGSFVFWKRKHNVRFSLTSPGGFGEHRAQRQGSKRKSFLENVSSLLKQKDSVNNTTAQDGVGQATSKPTQELDPLDAGGSRPADTNTATTASNDRSSKDRDWFDRL